MIDLLILYTFLQGSYVLQMCKLTFQMEFSAYVISLKEMCCMEMMTNLYVNQGGYE